MRDKIHKLETLVIYQETRELICKIYNLTKDFPDDEKYGIASQIRLAAISIGANIAEGYGRYSHKEEILFNYRARGYLFECYFLLDFSREIGIIKRKEFTDVATRINQLGIKVNNYIRYIKNRNTH
jgi:four helix bundle protein